jgi:hypothetical protein
MASALRLPVASAVRQIYSLEMGRIARLLCFFALMQHLFTMIHGCGSPGFHGCSATSCSFLGCCVLLCCCQAACSSECMGRWVVWA